MSSSATLLMTNESYLEELTAKLNGAEQNLKTAAKAKQTAMDLYIQVLTNKKSLDDQVSKLSGTESKAHTVSKTLNIALNLIFDENPTDSEERDQYVIKNLGHTFDALQSLVVDIFKLSKDIEAYIATINTLEELLAKEENAEQIKENLAKLKEASLAALDSTVAALQSVLVPYKGLRLLMAYFPAPRAVQQPDIDALGDVTHSIKYLHEESKKLMHRFTVPTKKAERTAWDKADGLYNTVKLSAADAEAKVETKRSELAKAEKQYNEADATYQAFKASHTAALAANGGA